MRKKIEQDYLDLAKKRGLQWFGPFPKNTHLTSWWGCEKMHRWEASYANIRTGWGCPHCSGNASKIEKDYYDLAKVKGFKWLGKKLPENTKIKTLWGCKKGHQWLARYNNVYRGDGCPFCAGNYPKIEKDYYKLAKSREFKWCGRELPKSSKVKTRWQCKKGHQWKATYNDIQCGNGCPYCYGNVRKTEKDYYDLADKYLLKWLGGKLPKNTHTKTLWLCVNGHKFKSRYDGIRTGVGCPYCAGLVKKIENDYHRLASIHKFFWVGESLPKNTGFLTLWQCKNNHIFKSRYDGIKQGHGCPYCYDMINGCKVSKPQRRLNEMLHGSLNYPEARYRIDVAIMRKSQKIAVEYDCWYWHKGKEDYDKKRDLYLLSKGWKVLHIKSGELLPTKKQLKKAINKLLNNKIFIINIYLDDWKK